MAQRRNAQKRSGTGEGGDTPQVDGPAARPSQAPNLSAVRPVELSGERRAIASHLARELNEWSQQFLLTKKRVDISIHIERLLMMIAERFEISDKEFRIILDPRVKSVPVAAGKVWTSDVVAAIRNEVFIVTRWIGEHAATDNPVYDGLYVEKASNEIYNGLTRLQYIIPRLTTVATTEDERPGPLGEPAPENKLGRNLKTLRVAANLTQVDLSQRSGVTQSHISAIERGAFDPRTSTIQALARALNVHPGQLFGEPPEE